MPTSETEVLVPVIQRLVDDFAGWLPAAAVIECVTACRDELRADGVAAGIGPAVRAMARARLRDRVFGPPLLA